ncbi:rhodanese-like domain-containing protein [Antrihabitans sp. NCIMB 15449]|uniref:Rhodanese-like domain-containing protein n=1 Tax=Antrihabitans spumae TaxID=3373370 RepID=A0ABW7JSW8_9NOCA
MTVPHVDSVSVADLPADFSDSVVLLDVREADEWELGHAPSAVHIPMGDVPARFGEIDPDAQLYVICRQGGRSARVVEYLQQVGYESVNVRGGMVAWQKAGLPLVSDGSAEAKIY